MRVYVLQHTHDLGEDQEDTKMLGVYSSKAAAEQAIQRFQALPGFKKSQDGFALDEYVLDEDHWVDGFETL